VTSDVALWRLIDAAEMHEAQGRLGEALAAYRKALRHPVLRPWAEFHEALIARRLGDRAAFARLVDPRWTKPDALTPRPAGGRFPSREEPRPSSIF
jgi:hypothetical protein